MLMLPMSHIELVSYGAVTKQLLLLITGNLFVLKFWPVSNQDTRILAVSEKTFLFFSKKYINFVITISVLKRICSLQMFYIFFSCRWLPILIWKLFQTPGTFMSIINLRSWFIWMCTVLIDSCQNPNAEHCVKTYTVGSNGKCAFVQSSSGTSLNDLLTTLQLVRRKGRFVLFEEDSLLERGKFDLLALPYVGWLECTESIPCNLVFQTRLFLKYRKFDGVLSWLWKKSRPLDWGLREINVVIQNTDRCLQALKPAETRPRKCERLLIKICLY